MASNSSLLVLLLLAAVAVSSSLADTDISGLLSGLSQGAAVASLHDTMQCMQKLVPCKSYLNVSGTTEQPPESCCSPLKEMVSDDFECLCRFYKDPQILKSLNVTRHDALQLPKACHVRLRLSKCSKEASAPTTTPIPTDTATTQAAAAAVLAAVSSANGSNMPAAASTSSSTSSTKSISHFGVVVVVAASASLFFMHY